MHIEGTEEWEDEQADILSGKCIDVDFLNYTPELRDTPKVQDAQLSRRKRSMTGKQKSRKYKHLRQNLISYLMRLIHMDIEIRYLTQNRRYK